MKFLTNYSVFAKGKYLSQLYTIGSHFQTAYRKAINVEPSTAFRETDNIFNARFVTR